MIQVLVGMIASGKTTYSKIAAQEDYICMNDDAIVNMLHADQYTLYKEDLKPLYKTIENTIVGMALAMNKKVVIDRGLNVSKRARARWIAIAKSYDVPCEAVVFKNEGPQVHATRRASSDSRGYTYEQWLTVANKHNAEWETPTLSEGFDIVSHIPFKMISKHVKNL